jgi:hypothetical protein
MKKRARRRDSPMRVLGAQGGGMQAPHAGIGVLIGAFGCAGIMAACRTEPHSHVRPSLVSQFEIELAVPQPAAIDLLRSTRGIANEAGRRRRQSVIEQELCRARARQGRSAAAWPPQGIRG